MAFRNTAGLPIPVGVAGLATLFMLGESAAIPGLPRPRIRLSKDQLRSAAGGFLVPTHPRPGTGPLPISPPAL
jgi:hypothetical protein